jgi:hypothetical protein
MAGQRSIAGRQQRFARPRVLRELGTARLEHQAAVAGTAAGTGLAVEHEAVALRLPIGGALGFRPMEGSDAFAVLIAGEFEPLPETFDAGVASAPHFEGGQCQVADGKPAFVTALECNVDRLAAGILARPEVVECAPFLRSAIEAENMVFPACPPCRKRLALRIGLGDQDELSVLENRAHLALPLRGPIRAGRTYDGRRPHSMRCFCNCEGGVRRMATAVPSRQQARYGVRRCRAAVCLGHLALLVTFPFSETECSRTFIFILCRHLGQMEWTSVDKKTRDEDL